MSEPEEMARIAADIAATTGQPYAEAYAAIERAMTERIALEAEVDRLRADLADARKLLPVESMALTVARAQVQRGENPQINTTAMLLMTIERLSAGGGGPAEGDGDE